MLGRARVVAAIILVVGMVSTSRAQQSTLDAAVRLLDVPYIQQSEILCGGAAAAMVMRYWGATGIYAESFAPLVDRAAGGIRGEDLLRELDSRGWDARSFQGSPDLVRARLRDGQPVVALIEDRPGAYHYVVVVAWDRGRVFLHDPARAPHQVLLEAVFDSKWQKSDRWTMLLLPPASGVPVATTPEKAVERRATACSPLVDQAVAAANAGDAEAAMRMLKDAAGQCGDDPAPWREMAGVFAVRGEWRDAASHAQQALKRDRADAHAWRILATARFLTDDPNGALEAWNAVAEPTLDIVNVRGLQRMRHSAAMSAMRLKTQTVLTRDGLAAATRRLSEVPAAQLARVNYRPQGEGRVAVDAVLIERSRTPFSYGGLAMMGLRALTEREIGASFANPTGAGDLATVTWRWWERRPRIAASYAAPLSFGGVLRLDGYRDQQSYVGNVQEVRRGGGVTFSDWTRRQLRWELSAGGDVWSGRGKTLTLNAAVEQRASNDRVSIEGSLGLLAGGFSSWTSTAGIAWRSRTRNEGSVFLSRAGVEIAGHDAPLALWSGAGVGHARRALLRAHPLLSDGVIDGEIFGRRLYHATGEWRAWSRPFKTAIRFAPAVFLDVARAERRLLLGDAWHADAGAGLRIAIPGNNVLRVDVAKGLRDGKTQLSVAWAR